MFPVIGVLNQVLCSDTTNEKRDAAIVGACSIRQFMLRVTSGTARPHFNQYLRGNGSVEQEKGLLPPLKKQTPLM